MLFISEGQRNALGSILGKRNSAWLTGTARAFVVGFGFNTHTGPNDRLPITEETHEPTCKRRCVEGPISVSSMARIAQCAQSQTTGYFAGYLVKAQPCGRYELKKCTDKMYTLRERIKTRTPGDQVRAVCRRMLTDLEQKGILRGAVECFNLCVNLRADDSLFQECIRTFMTVSFAGNAFLHRLELELGGAGVDCFSTWIPTTRRPHVRSKCADPPWVDVYGFRDIKDERFAMLSPFEFPIYWSAKPVLHPEHKDSAGRSRWCKGGKEFYEAHKHDPYGPKLVAGTHYHVVEDSDDFVVFPEDPVLKVFRHRWVLVRNPRPMVPVFQNTKLPRPGYSAEENARLCSVYFRPWTLHKNLAEPPHVPHLLQLAMYPEVAAPAPAAGDQPRRRLSRKRPLAEGPEVPRNSWTASWGAYIRGNVVSEHASRLITNFLTATLARTAADDDSTDEEADDPHDDDFEPLCPSLDDVHKLLEATTPENDERQRSGIKQAHARAMRRGRFIWGAPAEEVEATVVDAAGDRPTLTDYGKAARAAGRAGDRRPMPFSGSTQPHAAIYEHGSAADVDRWLLNLTAYVWVKRPTAMQLAVLKRVAERVKQEWLEEQAGLVGISQEEPMFDLIHGLPGAGKSEVIAWIQQLFEEVLGWTSGSQYICLAYTNAAAANISGVTIHSWADIKWQDGGQRAEPVDVSKVFLRCQSLRWLLVDEVSMVSAELLAQLQYAINQAMSSLGTYKARPDKSPRPFGGLNTLLVGDWWQLPPVKATSLTERPSRPGLSSTAREGLALLWDRTRDSVRRIWELTQPMRCDDPWFFAFLQECRNGRLGAQNYFYIHGVPTDTVGSMIPGETAPRCGSASCAALQDGRWRALFLQGASGAELMGMECAICQAERTGRHRVVDDVGDPRFQEAPFDAAPYIHPHNVPKYAAFHLRAALFARRSGRCLHWVCAHDKPLHRDDLSLPAQALTEKRRRWLRFHDQDTEGIMGLFPMIRGLPARLTQTVNKGLKLFKHRRCTIQGWTLHPNEDSKEANGERSLRYQPKYIYIKFENATWQIEDLEPGVYPLQPRSVIWAVNKQTKVKAKRTGFDLVPDFSGTCNMYQGSSLLAAIVDCLMHDTATKPHDMLAAYVGPLCVVCLCSV